MTVFLAARFCMNDTDCSFYHMMTGDRPKAPFDGGSSSEHHAKGHWELTNNNALKHLHLSHCSAGLTGCITT